MFFFIFCMYLKILLIGNVIARHLMQLCSCMYLKFSKISNKCLVTNDTKVVAV